MSISLRGRNFQPQTPVAICVYPHALSVIADDLPDVPFYVLGDAYSISTVTFPRIEMPTTF